VIGTPGRRRHTAQRRFSASDPASGGGEGGIPPAIDPYRNIVFPNRIREHRAGHGHPKLLGFAARIPEIAYIRLSKIERGEVFARADELARIADAIGVGAEALLIDVDAPDFDMAAWALRFAEGGVSDDADEARFAILLAAAVRRQREVVPHLTASAIDTQYGLAPVILSRIENAQKGLGRWSAEIVTALCRLFEVPDEAALRRRVEAMHADGALDRHLPDIADPERRRRRTSQRIAALAAELRRPPVELPPRPTAERPAAVPGAPLRPRLVPVHGAPASAPGGILLLPTGAAVEAPTIAGPRSFGVRIGRAVLGAGLPGHATVIVDPDRYPQAGGLALVRDGEVHRVVAVLLDRSGALIGHAAQPEYEVAIDTLASGDVAAVIAAQFV